MDCSTRGIGSLSARVRVRRYSDMMRGEKEKGESSDRLGRGSRGAAAETSGRFSAVVPSLGTKLVSKASSRCPRPHGGRHFRWEAELRKNRRREEDCLSDWVSDPSHDDDNEDGGEIGVTEF
ncbi:hypothetical protein ACLB2K_012335 [Fragaria x ananassa]